MATNADGSVEDDNKEVTEQDLRELKYGKDGVETPKNGADETGTGQDGTQEETAETGEAAGQTAAETTETTEETDKTGETDDSQYVKEFPNIKGETLDEYAHNLEQSYRNSTAEALRLKRALDEATASREAATPDNKPGNKDDDKGEAAKAAPTDPLSLYMQQKMDEEIQTAYKSFSTDYPQVNDQSEYGKFTREVAVLSNTIMQTQKRLASPEELYSKAAVILGWEKETAPTGKDKLNIALKNKAAISKTNSATKSVTKSKVTDAMISVNRMMYPGKSDDEIRKELEPYVQ